MVPGLAVRLGRGRSPRRWSVQRMGTRVIHGAWALAAVLALTACGSGEPTRMDDPDAPLRAAFTQILADANSVLYGDLVNYVGNSDAERIPARCRADTCSIGFIR